MVLPAKLTGLRCPECAADFPEWSTTMLVCGQCSKRYPVIEGIPVLLKGDLSKYNFEGFAQQIRSKAQTGQPVVAGDEWSEAEWRRFFFGKVFPQVNGSFPQWDFLFEITMALKSSLEPGTRILDIGAGECKYKPFLAHCDYVSFDFAQTGSQYDFSKLDVIADALAIPFDDESFDATMSFAVLEHVPSMEIATREMARILKPGGECHVLVPLVRPEHMVPFDFFRATRYGMEKLLTESGLEILACKESNGSLWTAIHYCWLIAIGTPLVKHGKSLRGILGTLAWRALLSPLLLYGIKSDAYYAKDFPIYFYFKARKSAA